MLRVPTPLLGLLNVVLCGLKDVKRGVIKCEQMKLPDGKTRDVYGLAVEGYGLRDVMGTQGVKALQATSNHVMEVAQVRQFGRGKQKKCLPLFCTVRTGV